MRSRIHRPIAPVITAAGGAAGIVVAFVLVLSLAAGGGYWAYTKYYKQPPLRTKLAAMKTKEELVRFAHDTVSPALYRNLVTMDDIVVMMDKEADRLNRIARKFPNQKAIIATQTEALAASREKLATEMSRVLAALEKIYVTWLVDRSRGTGQINAQRGTLTRRLADAIRGEAVLIGRIRSNPDQAG